MSDEIALPKVGDGLPFPELPAKMIVAIDGWAQSGKISAIRTLGGHRRFNAAEIMRHVEEQKSA